METKTIQISKPNGRRAKLPENSKCFECGSPAEEMHHIVPFSYGGEWTIPICCNCHNKVHNGKCAEEKRSQLIKDGLEKAKERGAVLGAPKKVDDSKILHLLKTTKLSYAEIAKQTGYGKSSVGRVAKQNLTEEVVVTKKIVKRLVREVKETKQKVVRK